MLWTLGFVLRTLLSSQALEIPFVASPDIAINGILEEPAWSQGKVFAMGPENTIKILHDKEFLYLAHSSRETDKRYMEVQLRNREGDSINLHASMQLGQRIEGQGMPFRWGTFATWAANRTTAGELESEKPICREFRINKKLIPVAQLEILVRLTNFYDESDVIVQKLLLKLAS